MPTEVLKAYKFTLDPTPTQREVLARHAGAARWAFNYALAEKVAAHEEWRRQVAELVAQGIAEAEARKKTRAPVPGSMEMASRWRKIRDLPKEEGGSPWYGEVNTYAFTSAFRDVDAAWKNWLDSLSGRRVGRRLGYPRFKKKGCARDSFRLHHDVKKPGIRVATNRRLRLPKIGEVRLHDSARRMARLVERERAVVQSVTVSRTGHRWTASVLCKVRVELPPRPTSRQRAAGRVGVDWGVKYLAALSKPLTPGDDASRFVKNPRHVSVAEKRLIKAQRALSRTQKGSARREKAKRRVGRLHQQVAERRAGWLHQVTKRLATGFEVVAVEDLNVAGMTSSARGTAEVPGKRVRQKAGLNRAVLDASPGELRRHLAYKTSWYGSKLAVLDRWWPSSKTCSDCGWRDSSQTLSDRVFVCGNETCGLRMDRDVNAARNIERHATLPEEPVACDRRETDEKNARGAPVRPVALRGRGRGAAKREDTGPQGQVPPQRSDPLTSMHSRPTQQALF